MKTNFIQQKIWIHKKMKMLSTFTFDDHRDEQFFLIWITVQITVQKLFTWTWISCFSSPNNIVGDMKNMELQNTSLFLMRLEPCHGVCWVCLCCDLIRVVWTEIMVRIINHLLGIWYLHTFWALVSWAEKRKFEFLPNKPNTFGLWSFFVYHGFIE